ncbi:phosphoglycerate mutase-like protein [Hypoxylon cercidicola]|nr:phosphoglycerate mutase-like protein [Hypoxylon cercidicola]
MSLEVIYVTRHGFRSSWNVDPSTGTYTASIRSPTGLPTDPSLTSHGVQQANDLATHLLSIDPPVEQVYSSPYYRCMQTIQPFVRNLRRLRTRLSGNVSEEAPKIRVDTALSEWYGLAQFEHPSSAPLNELQNHFPELDATYASTLAPSRRGESLPQLHDRIAQAIDAIIRRSDEEGRKAVLISTHAAVVIALGRVLTGQMEYDFGAFTCGLSKYRRRNPVAPGSSARAGGKPGSNAVPLAARSERRIGDARSTTPLDIDFVSGADQYPHDSRRPHPLSSKGDESALYGGWTCELDSDCSFLRGGEERGWKFSGDESFIETDGNGSWPHAGPSSDTAGGRPETEMPDSHISPKVETSKL